MKYDDDSIIDLIEIKQSEVEVNLDDNDDWEYGEVIDIIDNQDTGGYYLKYTNNGNRKK